MKNLMKQWLHEWRLSRMTPTGLTLYKALEAVTTSAPLYELSYCVDEWKLKCSKMEKHMLQDVGKRIEDRWEQAKMEELKARVVKSMVTGWGAAEEEAKRLEMNRIGAAAAAQQMAAYNAQFQNQQMQSNQFDSYNASQLEQIIKLPPNLRGLR